MAWIHLVTLLALIEFFMFAVLVARARGLYNVPAPAMSGHEKFDRYFRVHYNTLEMLVMFIPALWIAAAYWNPLWMALIGFVYVFGRVLYIRGYVADPKARSTGFLLSIAPIFALMLAGLAGIARVWLGW